MIWGVAGVLWEASTLLVQPLINTAMSKDHGDNIVRKEADIPIGSVNCG